MFRQTSVFQQITSSDYLFLILLHCHSRQMLDMTCTFKISHLLIRYVFNHRKTYKEGLGAYVESLIHDIIRYIESEPALTKECYLYSNGVECMVSNKVCSNDYSLVAAGNAESVAEALKNEINRESLHPDMLQAS